MYFLSILRAHTIIASLRYVHVSNYQNCKTVYLFGVLGIVKKNSILHVAEFLDMPLIIEKIDLSLRFVLRDC